MCRPLRPSKGTALNWLTTLRFDKPPFLIAVDVLAVASRSTCSSVRRSVAPSSGLAIAAAGAATRLVHDLALRRRARLLRRRAHPGDADVGGAGFAGIALAVANLFRARWWRKVIAA